MNFHRWVSQMQITEAAECWIWIHDPNDVGMVRSQAINKVHNRKLWKKMKWQCRMGAVTYAGCGDAAAHWLHWESTWIARTKWLRSITKTARSILT